MATNDKFHFADQENYEVDYTSLTSTCSSAQDQGMEGESFVKMPHEGKIERVAQWRMAALASWEFAFSALTAFFIPLLLPLQTVAIVGKDNKGTALGLGLAVATVIGTLIGLVAGQLSDSISTRFGKRTPFVVLASVGLSISSVAMAWYGDLGLTGAGVYVVYAMLLVLVRTFVGVAETAFQPLLPDLIPKEQMGTASGWWAMSQMLGNVFGAAATPFIMDQTSPVIITIILSTAVALGTFVSMVTNRERPSIPNSTQEWNAESTSSSRGKGCKHLPGIRFVGSFFKPFLVSSDFRWIFATRFVTQLGWGFITNFVFYFVDDVVLKPYHVFSLELSNANAAVGVVLGSVLITAVLSGYLGGALGDRFGRKRMVYVSSALQSLSSFGFVLLCVWPQQLTYVVIASVLMGLGLGAYLAVDFALATECLPSEQSRGTDLAVWGLASALPIAFSGPLGGLMLDNGQKVGDALGISNLGYVCIYGSCTILLVLSAVLVRFITVGSPVKKKPSVDEPAIDLGFMTTMEDDPFLIDDDSAMCKYEKDIN